jgi:hypothetical protein
VKIGITIFPPKTGFSFWSNGAHQNCMFLWRCLRAGGLDVVMINGGDGDAPSTESLPPELRAVQFVRMEDAIDEIDVLIEAGAQVSAENVARIRDRGGRAFSYKFGNALAIDAERAMRDESVGSIFNGARFDEIWTTTQHTATCGAYWEISHRCPVRVLPHIWDPCFVDALAADCRKVGLTTGYQPGRAKKRIAIFEPNINLIKTAHVAMLICESAFRKRPELFDRVLVMNAQHLRERLQFKSFAGNLDIAKTMADDGHAIMTFEPRFNTPWFMSAHADVVVSHQWLPAPNYLAYDVLRLGYPLIHNAEGMPGYFYPAFDAINGGDVLIDALTTHDDRVEQYRNDAEAFLATRRSTSHENVEAHRAALEMKDLQ